MQPSVFSLTGILLAVLFAVGSASGSSPSAHHGGIARRHHYNRLTRDLSSRQDNTNTTNTTSSSKPRRVRRSCVKKPSAPLSQSQSQSPSQSQSAATTKPAATKTTTTKLGSTSSPKPISNAPSSNGKGKPSNWPTETQPGAAPSATRTSAADPFLLSLSKAFNNRNNALFTQKHVGQMTYYGQGLGACGDTYDDNSFTAAVSKLMYDAWPGAIAGEMNRNPICGPFVRGRKVINNAGQFVTAVAGSQFVNVGGDGLLNCDTSSQCHIPLTATVKHGDKTIIVKIVDRCEGCAVGDIDLTPAAFAALADMGLGRTSVEWWFNDY